MTVIAPVEKVNLLGMSPEKMEAFFTELGEKRFRVNQVLQWVHQYGVDDFDEMTNLSKAFRAKLQEVAEVRPPEILSRQDSKDGTRKWVIRINSGSSVETVYIPDGNRGTLCVSSQAGCALDCSFCSTGKQGFNSDLTVAEIIGQVWLAAKSFGQLGKGCPDKKVTNVVMMGMGEPLLNFDNVVDAMNLMMNDFCYGLSKRRVTLSTSGVVPALYKLAEVTDVALAVSLHAPNDELRNQLVPINKKYNIEELLKACRHYMDSWDSTKRVVTVEYTLMQGINDSVELAQQLADLLREFPCKVNLIPFNPFPHSGYKRPSNNAVKRFQQTLQQAGYTTTIRSTRGDDIDAACGQLVGQVQDKTRRNERYIATLQDITGLSDNDQSGLNIE